jgi:hypothetical protein
MKAVFLFPIVGLMGALPAVAQPAKSCGQVVQSINNLATTITGAASSYWSHRSNFVDLRYGPSSLAVPNAIQLADQEGALAGQLKAAMPNTLMSLKVLLASASSQNCLPPAQLSAIAEPVIKSAKGVNFDQVPAETPMSGPMPSRMPRK